MDIPVPHAVLDVPTHDNSLIRVRHYGNRNGPRLFMLHGNGYASDAYFPFWQNFINSFEVVLFDLRNHGHNPQSDASEHTFRNMVRDLELVVRAADEKFGKKARTGVFHSGGGLIATMNALEFGTHWDALVLVDPPHIPQPTHPIFAQITGFESKLVQFALNRRFRFNHPDELAEELRRLRVNANWVSGSHELMARSILRKDDKSSEYLLVCAPELEASFTAKHMVCASGRRPRIFGGRCFSLAQIPRSGTACRWGSPIASCHRKVVSPMQCFPELVTCSSWNSQPRQRSSYSTSLANQEFSNSVMRGKASNH